MACFGISLVLVKNSWENMIVWDQIVNCLKSQSEELRVRW